MLGRVGRLRLQALHINREPLVIGLKIEVRRQHTEADQARDISLPAEVLAYAGSLMLAAQGMQPPKAAEVVALATKRVLYAPADGSWDYIQPNADVLKEIRENIQAIVEDTQRLGLQPLAQRSGGITATATSVESAKAHSAVQARALGLEDAIEQAFVFTSQWLGEHPGVQVSVHTDFMAGSPQQVPLDTLNKARAATPSVYSRVSPIGCGGGRKGTDGSSPDPGCSVLLLVASVPSVRGEAG